MDKTTTQYQNMIFAPADFSVKANQKVVFLAGSIDKKSAVDWHTKIALALETENILLLNPTRFSWDSSWKLSADDPQFNEQVSWELKSMEIADLVIVNFLPESQSPISLLEFGLYAKSGKTIICCPEGFWKKGNVDVVCRRYQVEQTNNLEELIASIKKRLITKTTRQV
jgi:Nucleoside 2-deoxyribosyltransferase like